ncbi:ABC transporter permease [Planomonospora sp. ID91781]|uniref:ABC transporter permease n=1 Tax=Planomonospora sp. ID91781 TaxID=2738135 RepID=UPI0018C3D5EB|nr:ABC transporter permease [Planomonospora sp. ID91781]MBG0823690.1 ABC transporter permease [Planomonospora sp. ID91781]
MAADPARLSGVPRLIARAGALLTCASIVIFLLTEALPGDSAVVLSGGRATDEQLAQLRAAAGLDRPLTERYASWLAGMLSGEPGHSLLTGRSVAELIGRRIPVTLMLAAAALALAVPLMALLAWSAVRGPRPLRPVITGLVVAGAALPQVALAALLVAVLSAAWKLVPPVSLLPVGEPAWSRPDLLVLPVLTLALPAAAYGAALLRGAIADAVSRPFVRDAELRGMSAAAVALRYALPAVAPAAARLLAVVGGGLVAGTAVVETLFGLAGLGELLVSAIGGRDLPVVQAVAMLATAVVGAGLTAADTVAWAVDPRGGAAR